MNRMTKERKAAPTKTSNRPQDEQSTRFIEAAREAGCSEDEAVFDSTLKSIVKAKPKVEHSAAVLADKKKQRPNQ